MNAIVQTLNTAGRAFVDFAVPMLIQSSVLVLILLVVDAVLRKRVRAVFRYWIWMLVLVKLVLPPSLWSPVSVGTWFGDKLEISTTALLEWQGHVSRAFSPRFEGGTLSTQQGQDALATRPSPAIADFLSRPPRMFVELPLPDPRDPAAPGWDSITPGGGGATSPIGRPAALSLNWQGLVLLVWIAVVVALLLLLAQRTFFVQGLVAQADEASRAMLGELDQCRRRLGLPKPISLRLSPNAASPAVCGLRRPVILVPQNLASRLHGADLQAILFHELAHVKRGDLWVSLAQTLLQIVYFYNPLLWLANAVIRRIREKAVDETVLIAMGEAAPQYPETLVNVAKLAFTRRPALSLRLIGMVESKSALASRVKHILNRPIPKTARLGILSSLLVIAIATVLLPMAKAKPMTGRAQEAPAPTKEQQEIADKGAGGGALVEPEKSEATQGDTLKRLLDAAQPGSVVALPKGRYTTPVEMTKPVVLRGESADDCVIEVTADQPVILVNTKGQGPVTIENLTIRWQLATDKKVELPAAVLVKGTNVVIRNCRFAPLGDVKRSPMAVYIDGKSKSTVDNCRFRGFDYVVCYGQGTEGVVQDCIITDCGHQGIINYDGATLTVQRNIITGSKFHAVRNTGGTLHVKDNLLIKNANRGIYLGNRTGRGTITNNLILGNGEGIPAFGRADYAIANNVILNNDYAGIDMRDSCRLSIRNNVLGKNQRGLALFKEGTQNFNVVSPNVFWANATDAENLEKPAGSVTADPQFADPNHGDFAMRAPVREQEYGLTNLQILKDLWKRYEQLQTASSKANQPQTPARNATESAPQELSGRVLDPQGKPAAGAQVALSTDKIGVVIHDGKLEQPRTSDMEKGPIVETDAEGRFRFEGKPPEDFDVITAHASGFALVGSDELRKNSEIRLERWGRIEGQLAPGQQALSNQIWMAGLPNETWLKHKREFRYQTHADAAGRFTFDHVPAGWFEVGYLSKTGDIFSSPTSRTPVVVKAGEATPMKLGGEGRPVIGRFVPPAGYNGGPVYFGAGLRSLETVRPEPPRPANYNEMTKREQQEWLKQWWQSPEYRAYSDRVWHNPDWRHYTFRVQEDGTFRIEDVIAGQYELTVWLEERFTGRGRPEEIGAYNGTIEVLTIPGGRSEEPLDLGNLTVSMHNPPLHAGDTAPLFEAKTLDGKELRLIDYRGKFVLLSFWQPVSNPELDRLKELYKTYGGTGRLQIIGLGGWDTLEEVRRYVAEHKIEWPEVYFGTNASERIAAQYGLPGVPYLLLINSEGKIVATELRGETLTETVRQAMD
jgi:beta-lactamase regulating signal transducer with metallopeptidase domain/peroxiredoxin